MRYSTTVNHKHAQCLPIISTSLYEQHCFMNNKLQHLFLMHTCECGGQLAIFWTFYDDDDGRYFWEKEMCRGDNGKKQLKVVVCFYVNMHICPFFMTPY